MGSKWVPLAFLFLSGRVYKKKTIHCHMSTGLASTADDQKYEILGKYELKSGSLSKTVRSRLKKDDFH